MNLPNPSIEEIVSIKYEEVKFNKFVLFKLKVEENH